MDFAPISWTLLMFLISPNQKMPIQSSVVQGFRSEEACQSYSAQYFPQINQGFAGAKRRERLVGACTQVLGPIPPVALNHPGNIGDIEDPVKIGQSTGTVKP